MATNLAIDEKLLNEALTEYVQRRKQLEIMSLSGKIDYGKVYNYKKGRSRK